MAQPGRSVLALWHYALYNGIRLMSGWNPKKMASNRLTPTDRNDDPPTAVPCHGCLRRHDGKALFAVSIISSVGIRVHIWQPGSFCPRPDRRHTAWTIGICLRFDEAESRFDHKSHRISDPWDGVERQGNQPESAGPGVGPGAAYASLVRPICAAAHREVGHRGRK